MTKMKVSSYICGITHTIMGRVEGDKIIIEIDTPCEKFRDLSHLEFPLQEMYETQDKLALEMARKTECNMECALDCTQDCLIPPAVFNICSIEKEHATATPFDSIRVIGSEFEIPEFESSEFENPEFESPEFENSEFE